MPAKETPTAAPKTQQQQPAASHDIGRKPWRKKSPVEVFLDQEEKLRKEVSEMEHELKQKRTQLQKFEQARKLFEAS